MIALLLMLALTANSIAMPGSGGGLKVYLTPDFSKINGSVTVGAMDQAFSTLWV